MNFKDLEVTVEQIQEKAQSLFEANVYDIRGGRYRSGTKSRAANDAHVEKPYKHEPDLDRPKQSSKGFDVSVFHGNIYKDKSRLKARKFSLFGKARQTKLKGRFGKFEPIFIIGYELKQPHVMYELWYDSVTGKYGIFDQFAGQVGRLEDRLEDAVEQMVDQISKEEVVSDENDFQRKTIGGARASIRGQGYKPADFDYDRVMDVASYQKDLEFVEKILNENISSKEFLFKAINQSVNEYHDTRMKKHELSKIWGKILGRELEFPSKFLPAPGAIGNIAQKVRKIFGREKEATFVIGFTFQDRLDFEIWYVKKPDQNVFYVFDLNSGKAIGEDLRNLRSAYHVLAKKLAVPEDLIKQAVEDRRV